MGLMKEIYASEEEAKRYQDFCNDLTQMILDAAKNDIKEKILGFLNDSEKACKEEAMRRGVPASIVEMEAGYILASTHILAMLDEVMKIENQGN